MTTPGDATADAGTDGGPDVGIGLRHLLGTDGLGREQATALLDTAASMEQALTGRAVRKLPTLRGRTVVTLFYEDSTRTRVSFEVAGKWMSADTINVSASGSSVGKGESLRDTAATLAAVGADAVVVRHPASGAPHRIAAWLDAVGHSHTDGHVAVVNAGDGTHEHPTQALLDAATLRKRLGQVAGTHVAVVGDVLHSRVARSNAHLLSTLGAQVTLVSPPTLLPVGVHEWPVTVAHDLDAVIAGDTAHGAPDAVMMLRVQAERMHGGFFPSAREYAVRYGLTVARADRLPEAAVVLHPGPAVRGMEIASEVADAPRAAILDQVTAGVHVRMAVLYHLLAGDEAQRGSTRRPGDEAQRSSTRRPGDEAQRSSTRRRGEAVR